MPGESSKRLALFGRSQVPFNNLIETTKLFLSITEALYPREFDKITMPGLFTPRNVAIGGAGVGALLYFWPKGKAYVRRKRLRAELIDCTASKHTAHKTSLIGCPPAGARTLTLQQSRRLEVSKASDEGLPIRRFGGSVRP